MRTTDKTLGLLKNNGMQLFAYAGGEKLKGVMASDQVVGRGKNLSKNSLFDY
jgi:hypothetical protein